MRNYKIKFRGFYVCQVEGYDEYESAITGFGVKPSAPNSMISANISPQNIAGFMENPLVNGAFKAVPLSENAFRRVGLGIHACMCGGTSASLQCLPSGSVRLSCNRCRRKVDALDAMSTLNPAAYWPFYFHPHLLEKLLNKWSDNFAVEDPAFRMLWIHLYCGWENYPSMDCPFCHGTGHRVLWDKSVIPQRYHAYNCHCTQVRDSLKLSLGMSCLENPVG